MHPPSPRIHRKDQSFLGFNVYISVDLVKRGALSLVGKIWRYRNDRYYHLSHSFSEVSFRVRVDFIIYIRLIIRVSE